MPLDFGNTSGRLVTCPNVQSVPTIFTIMAWLYRTNASGLARLVCKGGGNGFINFDCLGATGTQPRVTIDYATTDATATGAAGSLPLNHLGCVAVTFDGVAGPKLYTGDLVTPITEVAYSAGPTAPVGARVSEATPAVILGNVTGGASNGIGRIYWVGWYPSVLSLEQLRRVQFRPDTPYQSLGRWTLGKNGAGLVLDESGSGNHGTITSAIPTNDVLPRLHRRAA